MQKRSVFIISLCILACLGWSLIVTAVTYDPIVEQAQKRLIELGYDPGPADGKMGKKTETAIANFQRDHQLPETGKLDEETIRKLGILGIEEQPTPVEKSPKKEQPDATIEGQKENVTGRSIGIVETQQDPLNIRSEPGKQAKVIGKVPKGEKLIIIADSGDWYKVQLPDGTVGYAASEYIRILQGEGSKEVFQIADIQLTFPIPSGYCVPHGEAESVAQEVAEIDDRNFTHIFIINCQQLEEWERTGIVKNYGTLKSPKGAIYKNWGNEREQFIENMLNEMNTKTFEEGITYAKDRIEQSVKGVRFGEFRNLGVIDKDESAFYIGVISSMSLANEEKMVATVGAITIVKQKLVFYYLHDAYENSDTVIHLLEDVKTHIRAFIKENDETLGELGPLEIEEQSAAAKQPEKKEQLKAAKQTKKEEQSLAITDQVETLLQQAKEYHNAGNYEKAIAFYTKVIELDSTHVDAYWNRGFSYIEQRRADLACADFRRVTELKPDVADGYGQLGWCLFSQNKFAEARQLYQKAHDLAPENGAWVMNLGHTYFFSGDMTTARTYYKKALPLFNSEEDFKQTTLIFEAFIKAGIEVEICRQELDWMKQKYDTLYREANTYWSQVEGLVKQGQYLEAARKCEKGVHAEKVSPEPRLSNIAVGLSVLGSCYKQVGEYAKGIDYFEQALEVYRELKKENEVASLLNKLGVIYVEQGYYDKALDYLEQALTLNRRLEKDAEIAKNFNNIGQVYDAWGQYDHAIGYYKQALEFLRKLGQDSEIAMTLNNIGTVHLEQGRSAEALEYFEKALELARQSGEDEENAMKLNNIGQVYYQQGQYDKALDYYEQGLKLARNSGRDTEIATILNNIGGLYHAWGRDDKALEYFEQGLELVRKLGRNAEIAKVLNNIGLVYNGWGQYAEALDYYEQALELARRLNINSQIATSLNNIGAVYLYQGQYAKALDALEQALKFARQLGRDADIIIILNSTGEVYKAWGHYDKAHSFYEQALELVRQLGKNAEAAAILGNIGSLYTAWGQYETSLTYYEQALEVVRQLGRAAETAVLLGSMSNVYLVWGQDDNMSERFEQALDYLEQALELNRKLGRDIEVGANLNSIGMIYNRLGKYAEALDFYNQGLELARQLGIEAEIATSLNNIGTVYRDLEQYDKALDYLEQGLELSRKLGRNNDIGLTLNNIGFVYYDLKWYPEAITHFVKSVDIIEQVRKTATGDVRRDYLDKVIETYQGLIYCYVRTGDFTKALETIELSRAKLLAERLAGSDDVKIPSLERIQNELPEDTAILVYANTGQRIMTQVVITREHIAALEHSSSDFIQNVNSYFQQDKTTTSTDDSRGLITVQEGKEEAVTGDVKQPVKFIMMSDIISYYRTLLMNPTAGDRGKRVYLGKRQVQVDEERKILGNHLYDFLLGDIQKQLTGKTKLLIVPDGVLNFLPFETLVDEQGKYLVENYQISYAQSLGVLELIKQRQYAPNRKPLLAFGGAVYDTPAYQVQVIENEAQLAYLQKQVDLALTQGSSVRAVYAQLRNGRWSNLPGTLNEVKAIQQIVDGAEILTGKDVNEAVIKKLSANGELAQYKVLHFATHGDADPRIPELSALVLSQFGEIPPTPPLEKGGENEDGYLRVGEIYKLKLNADFVNLSACETGLGKLYSGEGVIGLTQAFLLAGANGLSVSLWQVVDESTAEFMAALYKLVKEENLSYAAALTAVKRRFIKGEFGEQWQTPYYWAPFVYYGKN